MKLFPGLTTHNTQKGWSWLFQMPFTGHRIGVETKSKQLLKTERLHIWIEWVCIVPIFYMIIFSLKLYIDIQYVFDKSGLNRTVYPSVSKPRLQMGGRTGGRVHRGHLGKTIGQGSFSIPCGPFQVVHRAHFSKVRLCELYPDSVLNYNCCGSLEAELVLPKAWIWLVTLCCDYRWRSLDV